MNIIVFDNSGGKSWKHSRRLFSSLLPTLTDRIFVGRLSKRVIESMIYDLKGKISRRSEILLLISNKSGYHGWEGYYYGRKDHMFRYNEYLDLNNKSLCEIRKKMGSFIKNR